MRKIHTLEFYPSLVRVVGPVHAIVLSKIFYWCDGRLRVKRKGMLWLAKSRKEMCEETGFSLSQQKRAIAALKQQGLIIVEVGLFQNKVTPFIQLTKQGLALLEYAKSDHSTGTKPSQPIGAKPGHSTGAKPGQSSTVLHDTKNTTAPTALGGYAAKSKSKKIKQPDTQGKKKGQGQVPPPNCAAPPSSMDSKQVVAKLQEKKSVIPDSVLVKNAAMLAMWWQRLVPKYHSHHWESAGLKVKPLTHKEVGMLAGYLKAVGKEDAYAVMHWSVKEWSHFASAVIHAKGSKSGVSPTWPRVNYLYAHWDVAVICYKKSQQPNQGPVLLSEAEQKANILGGKK